MDQFGYLSVLISIILGLGITQLLSGVGRLLQARNRVRLYWPSLAWVLILLVALVQTWWAMFGLRFQKNWTFWDFLVVLLQPTLLYLDAALALPESTTDAVDLRAHYFAHSRPFFTIAALLLVVSVGRDLVLTGALPSAANLAAHCLWFVAWVIAALSTREALHKAVAVFTIGTMAAYIILLFRVLH